MGYGRLMKTKIIEHEGEIYTIAQLAEKIGLSRTGMRDRVVKFQKGEMTFEQLVKPRSAVNEDKRLAYIDEEGNRYDCKKISEITGITESAAFYRVKRALRGEMTKEQLLREPYTAQKPKDDEFGEKDLSPEQRKILEEFNRQTLPSRRKHDKYFPPLPLL